MGVGAAPDSVPELMPLVRMASRAGVPYRWLKEKAEAGDLPALKAGNRWLFRPDLIIPAVAAMADSPLSKRTEDAGSSEPASARRPGEHQEGSHG